MTNPRLCGHCGRGAFDCPIGAPGVDYCIEYRPAPCQAVQQSDQKVCNRCGLVWDMNDPDRPACLTNQQIGRAAIANARAALGDL